jgi:hypothetical protein
MFSWKRRHNNACDEGEENDTKTRYEDMTVLGCRLRKGSKEETKTHRTPGPLRNHTPIKRSSHRTFLHVDRHVGFRDLKIFGIGRRGNVQRGIG